MKILVVSHEFPPIGGGGANACYFLTKEFANCGNDVHVVTARFGNQEDETTDEGVYIHRVDCIRKHKEHCSFQEMLSFLCHAMPYSEKLHKEYCYDICLVFFGIPSGPIGYVLRKKYALPYMIRFGGGDIPGFQKRFSLLYRLLAPAIKIIWNNAESLVVNSAGLRKMALDFSPTNDFKVICNGVDTDYFAPAKDRNDEVVRILFVSRLIERKGLQDFIPQFREIVDNTNCNVELSIVGDGPYRSELENMVKKYDLIDFVRFEGHKCREDILKYYQRADIFILPSRKEGMPNVVLEAMACGLPIVMTPCEGSHELIDGNGYVSNVLSIKEKVLDLVNDEHKRKHLGLESRKRACKLFGWKKTAQEYISNMESIVLGEHEYNTKECND